jgi:hypothetical protein
MQEAVHRGRFAVLLFLLAVLASSVATAARCYPPDTRVVVFIQGLYTTYDGETQSTGIEGPRFSTLKGAFSDAGYDEEDLVDFSYRGGSIDEDGAWQPAHYPCELTDRLTEESLAVLEDMLRQIRASQERVHFTLVGHSLGGYLAYLEGVREADRAEEERLDIDVVVTLDAPLQGVSADKKTIIDLIPCEKTYAAGAEIVAQKLDPGIAAQREAEAVRMRGQGIRLATLGNPQDCLWNTGYCLPGQTWVDDSATQLIATAELSREFAIASNPLLSHDAILGDAAATQTVVEFVGDE